MICDVSKVEEVRDADGTPRYQRNFGVNDQALDAAIRRIEGSDQLFVAKRGSEIGTQAGCAAFLQFQSCETIGADLRRIEGCVFVADVLWVKHDAFKVISALCAGNTNVHPRETA